MRADEPHPEVQALLQRVDALDIMPINQYGATDARAMMEDLRQPVTDPSIGEITDRTVPGYQGRVGDQRDNVPVRVYYPDDEGPFPVITLFHGGGFVLGSLDGHDPLCRHLVAESGCVVVSVEYRLAPEHPFPAAIEDAYSVTEWVAENPDEVSGNGQLAVLGDSAGGNLAAAVTLMARERDGPDIDHQVLIYPAVDAREDRPSWTENSEGYYLVAEDMSWFVACYFQSDIHEVNPYALPLEAKHHADLPPATIVTAGFDPLRDEGIAYAEALKAHDVSVTHHNYADMIHGFMTMLTPQMRLTTAIEAVAQLGTDLRTAFR
jgi:acetyl esterase